MILDIARPPWIILNLDTIWSGHFIEDDEVRAQFDNWPGYGYLNEQSIVHAYNVDGEHVEIRVYLAGLTMMRPGDSLVALLEGHTLA